MSPVLRLKNETCPGLPWGRFRGHCRPMSWLWDVIYDVTWISWKESIYLPNFTTSEHHLIFESLESSTVKSSVSSWPGADATVKPAVALIDLVTKCTARDSSKSFKKTTALWIRFVLFGCLKACKDWDPLVAMTCKKDAQHDRPRQTPNPENRDCVKAKLGQGKADLPNWARRMKKWRMNYW